MRPLTRWRIRAPRLPERLTENAPPDEAFHLPGADALSAFADLLGAPREGGADDRLIHAVVCHGYGLCVDVKPEHEMEKVLFACDELTGLVGACAKMRPSGSIADMDLKSLKKKYKSKGFAAGCSREVIAQGAEMLGWTLDDLLSRTLEAMKPDEAAIAATVAGL